VPVERGQHAYAAFGAGRGFTWSEAAAAPSSAAPGASADARVPWLDAASLPADRTAPIGIDHLECSLDHHEDRVEMLQFLEELLYCHKRKAWIATARDPITQLQELPAGAPDWSEMARWIRVFKSFREVRVGLAHPTRRAQGDSEVQASLAAPYYRAVWSACSQREQLALRQLADEGVVNPRNEAILLQLMRSGLVRRDRTFHVMDEPFRLFVTRALSGEVIGARERGDATMPWTSVTTAMVTIALGLAALLVLTSQQLVDAWLGYVPALAPAVPTVLKFLTAVRHDGKPGVVNV
jgi:hypothetical protein